MSAKWDLPVSTGRFGIERICMCYYPPDPLKSWVTKPAVAWKSGKTRRWNWLVKWPMLNPKLKLSGSAKTVNLWRIRWRSPRRMVRTKVAKRWSVPSNFGRPVETTRPLTLAKLNIRLWRACTARWGFPSSYPSCVSLKTFRQSNILLAFSKSRRDSQNQDERESPL